MIIFTYRLHCVPKASSKLCLSQLIKFLAILPTPKLFAHRNYQGSPPSARTLRLHSLLLPPLH